MRSPARCLCSLLLLAATCWAGGPALTPRVDFGWLKATPMNNGWLLTYVFASGSTSGGLHAGDLLISVDDQTLEGLAPLSAAHVMQGLTTAESAIVYRDGAPVRLNFVSLDQRVIRAPLRRRNSVTQTFNSDTAAELSITLPDLTGLGHNLPFPPDGKMANGRCSIYGRYTAQASTLSTRWRIPNRPTFRLLGLKPEIESRMFETIWHPKA